MPKKKANPSLKDLLSRYSQNDVIAEMEREYASISSKNIPLSSIDDNHVVKKVSFPKDMVHSLGESLKEKGFFSPLLVRPSGTHYELILGRKRFVGAKEAGLKYVPCIIRDVSDEEVLLTLLADTRDQREGNVVEMALIFEALQEKYKYSQKTLGKVAHLSRSQVTNILRLLHLPDEVLKEIMLGTLSYGHAKAIASLSDKRISDIVRKIHKEHLSVRETEYLAKRIQNNESHVPSLEKAKEKYNASSVVVKKKSVTLYFASEKERDEFLLEKDLTK
ncbi:MAG TPA: chromosome partitioning protein ParB [Firmicutes bacterium]|nr:chromosome partitioning protein ParB [Bacillota bacterium]HBN00064.1 chromosome partitioning protein ParB [Bacillota bacterium]